MPQRAVSPAASENGFDITKSLFGQEESGFHDAVTALDSNAGLGGVLDLDVDSDGDDAFIAAQQTASNRKASNLKGKTVKKGGGFQAMGMSTLRREKEQ